MKPDTLYNNLYRATFRNETVNGWVNNAVLRDKLTNARRFLLDTEMSAFVGELGTRAFAAAGDQDTSTLPHALQTTMIKRLEALRTSALAPHHLTWIEYQLRPAMARSGALLGIPHNPENMPEFEGWLIERHPQMDTAVSLHLFSWSPRDPEPSGVHTWTFPVMYGWTINDWVPPWQTIIGDINTASAVATGMQFYHSQHVTIAQSPWLVPIATLRLDVVKALVIDWSGLLRRVWALLACINDIPTVRGVQPSAGSFFAKGRVRPYLDHHTIALKLPKEQQTKLAARVLGLLVKRRGGTVREHWRRHWMYPVSPQCPTFQATGVHAWAQDGVCTDCGGKRIRIPEHQRGDASQGFAVTDYAVTH